MLNLAGVFLLEIAPSLEAQVDYIFCSHGVFPWTTARCFKSTLPPMIMEVENGILEDVWLVCLQMGYFPLLPWLWKEGYGFTINKILLEMSIFYGRLDFTRAIVTLLHLQDEGCCNPLLQWPWGKSQQFFLWIDMTWYQKEILGFSIRIWKKTRSLQKHHRNLYIFWINMFDVWINILLLGRNCSLKSGMDSMVSSRTNRFERHSNCLLNKLDMQDSEIIDGFLL